jgi:glycosyltransferase involved in cell wall biosynthesis
LKKVLILSYYWPPGSGPGVQRWLKFCKYLPEFGWQPTIITVANGSYPNLDETLLEDVPSDLEVIKTDTFEPFAIYNLLRGKSGKAVEVGMGNIKGKTGLLSSMAKYIRANLFIPDARLGWNRYSYPKAIKWIKDNNPHLIITTGPPHSTHLVGQRLKSDFNIPWIADFRDPWTTIYYNRFLNRTERSEQKDKTLEDSVLSSANAILTATPGLKAEFEARAKTIKFIPNGFDEEDFNRVDSAASKSFKLSYIGNFKAVQNIEGLWIAISRIAKDSELKEAFQFEITGNLDESIQSAFRSHGIEHLVSVKPFVPHKAAIIRMFEANMLLLPIPQDASNKTILTGKIFEYLASRRPILSIGPSDGNASEILQSCGKSKMIDYDDTDEMERQIRIAIADFQNHKQLTQDGNDQYLQYSRKGTAKQLAHFLDEQTL